MTNARRDPAHPEARTTAGRVRGRREGGSPPPQSSTYGPAPQPADDDWLTVNVWTPAPDPAARLPLTS